MIIFLALDQPKDVKKLLSLELTGVFINEAREISKDIVDACFDRFSTAVAAIPAAVRHGVARGAAAALCGDLAQQS